MNELFGLTFTIDTFRKKINVSGYVQYPVDHGSELNLNSKRI